ncbi:uncharacterized protein LOC117326910 isoform X3 [Pecten maximus]|nr:uncharacterized protein LOC117326910 isoform X3 [Pecten maximus]
MGPERRRPRRQAALNNRAVRPRPRTELQTNNQTEVVDQSQQSSGPAATNTFPSAKEIAAQLLEQMLEKGVATVLPSVQLPSIDMSTGPPAALGAPPTVGTDQATYNLLHNIPAGINRPQMPSHSAATASTLQSVNPSSSSGHAISTSPSLQSPVQSVINDMTGANLPRAGSTHEAQPGAGTSTSFVNLITLVQHLLMNAIAPQTRKSYIRAFSHLQEFISTHFNSTPCLPTTVDMLVYFIAQMYSEQKATATIKTYVAAVGYINKLAGYSDPAQSFIIKKILTAVQRGSYQPDSRLPITPHILQKLVKALPRTFLSQYQQFMLKAMYLLAFHAFLRVGEMTVNSFSCHTLQFQDINIQYQHGVPLKLEVTFKSFKGNYNIRPIVISIERKQDASVCPVLALSQYISLRGTYPGHLFAFPINQPVSYQYFTDSLKQTFCAAGIDAKGYASHSFRIGAASTAAAQGIPDEDIQHMGRWKSLAFKRYIRLPTIFGNT